MRQETIRTWRRTNMRMKWAVRLGAVTLILGTVAVLLSWLEPKNLTPRSVLDWLGGLRALNVGSPRVDEPDESELTGSGIAGSRKSMSDKPPSYASEETEERMEESESSWGHVVGTSLLFSLAGFGAGAGLYMLWHGWCLPFLNQRRSDGTP